MVRSPRPAPHVQAAIRFTYYTMWMLSEQAFILGGIGTTGSSGEEFDQEQTMAIDPSVAPTTAVALQPSTPP